MVDVQKPPDKSPLKAPPLEASTGVKPQQTPPAQEASAQNVPPHGEEDLRLKLRELSLENQELQKEATRQGMWRDGKVVEHAKECDKLREQLADKDNELSQSFTQLSQLKQKATEESLAFNTQLAAKQEELNTSKAQVTALSKQLEDSSNEIRDLKAACKSAEASGKQLEKELEKLTSKCERLETLYEKHRVNALKECTTEMKHLQARSEVLAKSEAEDLARKHKLEQDEEALYDAQALLEEAKQDLISAEGIDLDELRLQARNAIKAEDEARPDKKAVQAGQHMKLREDVVKYDEAFVKRFWSFLESIEWTEGGIKSFVAKIKPKVEPEAKPPDTKTALANAPHVPRFNNMQAAQIYKEGRNMGYFEYARDADLVDALSGHYPKEYVGFDPATAPKHTSDVSNPRHPYQRGFELGVTLAGAILSLNHKHRPFDQRVWQQHAISTSHVEPYHTKQPKKGSFWCGVNDGIWERSAELEPLVKKLVEERTAAKMPT